MRPSSRLATLPGGVAGLDRHWVELTVVVEVSYTGVGARSAGCGSLCSPVYDPTNDQRRCTAMAERVSVKIENRQLSLSNLDKVLYPVTGFTKGELIDYYTRIAPVLLPHLADRPLTIKALSEWGGQAFLLREERRTWHAGLGAHRVRFRCRVRPWTASASTSSSSRS